LETIEHYAFYRKGYIEIKNKDIQDLKILQTSFQKALGYWKIEVIGKNDKIILETADKEIVKLLSKYKAHSKIHFL